MPFPHEKCPPCVAQIGLLLLAMQYKLFFVEFKNSMTSYNRPDPRNIFAMHMANTFPRTDLLFPVNFRSKFSSSPGLTPSANRTFGSSLVKIPRLKVCVAKVSVCVSQHQ